MNNIESYKIWWESANDNSLGAEVGIMVKNELSKHIYKVYKSKGKLIAIDMKFRGHSDVRIINVYMESNDAEKEQRKETINILFKWINQGKKDNKKLIVMGDFNADPEIWIKEKSTTTSIKYLILEKLKNENFVNLQKITNEEPLKKTWKITT